MQVEISLQIPGIKDPIKRADGWPINNADIRFLRPIEVGRLPKAGEVLELRTRPDLVFRVSVTGSNWHEEKEMFVVACRYSLRSIPRPEYLALIDAPDWTRKSLLP